MVAGMAARLNPGRYVYVTLPERPSIADASVDAVMTFVEEEGVTAVCSAESADEAGLPYDLVLAWITLTVHSALDDVGLTAAVSGALADAGIACNMIAARQHDHVLVPIADAERALEVLRQRAASEPTS